MSQVCVTFVIAIQILSSAAVSRMPRPYDLLWPVARRKETSGSALATGSVVEVKKSSHPPAPGSLNTLGRTTETSVNSSRIRLESYAALLLNDISEVLPGAVSHLSLEGGDEDTDLALGSEKCSCRQSVDIMTRNPKKGK